MQKCQGNVFQKILYNWPISKGKGKGKGKSAKEIGDMFSVKMRTVYNIISRSKKRGRLDLK